MSRASRAPSTAITTARPKKAAVSTTKPTACTVGGGPARASATTATATTTALPASARRSRAFSRAMKAAVEDNRLKTGPVWGIGETREPIEVLEAATVCAWAVDHMPAPAPAPAGPFEIW